MRTKRSDRISPTAHYTGAVWVRNNLSDPRLETRMGRSLYHALKPLNAAARLARQPNLEGLLLARHGILDRMLEDAIKQGDIQQVVEIGAGLSGRGWRLSRRYRRKLTYVETDLPGMTHRKRKLLVAQGALPKRHRVEPLDALAEDGPASLQQVVSQLDRDKGLCIITEGLLNYFDQASVETLWRRIADCLAGFPKGLYLSDLHVGSEQPLAAGTAFRVMLGTVLRSGIHFHYRQASEAESALTHAGFSQAAVSSAADHLAPKDSQLEPSARIVRIVRAVR